MRGVRYPRDMTLVQRVLRGETAASVGRDYGLPRGVAREIVHEVCLKANPAIYLHLMKEHEGQLLPWLREYREAFCPPQERAHAI